MQHLVFQVNGTVLYGRSHLNASAIIKGLNTPVIKFVLLRYAIPPQTKLKKEKYRSHAVIGMVIGLRCMKSRCAK